MIIESKPHWTNDRVQLFLLDESHVTNAYVTWLADPIVNKFLESRFSNHSIKSVINFVQTMRESDAAVFFGIRSLKLNRHVGNIKLEPIDFTHHRGEVGIMIGDQDAWGHGIGSAAIAAICDIGKQDLGLRKMTAGCYAANIGSQKAFEKAGFEVEAIRKRHFVIDENDEDLVLLAKFL